jgi:hypothetical protein
VKIINDLKLIAGAVTDHPRIDALVVTCCALFFGKSSCNKIIKRKNGK